MAIFDATSRPALATAFGGQANVRTSPKAPIIAQARRVALRQSHFKVAANRTVTFLGDYWSNHATTAFRDSWLNAIPFMNSRRRDLDANEAMGYLLFANYHHADVFHDIAQVMYEPGDLPDLFVSVSPNGFLANGWTWRLNWQTWPTSANNPRWRWYVYQLNPLLVQRGSPPDFFGTRLCMTYDSWGDLNSDDPLDVPLAWQVLPGQHARLFHRLRIDAGYAPTTSFEEIRP